MTSNVRAKVESIINEDCYTRSENRVYGNHGDTRVGAVYDVTNLRIHSDGKIERVEG